MTNKNKHMLKTLKELQKISCIFDSYNVILMLVPTILYYLH